MPTDRRSHAHKIAILGICLAIGLSGLIWKASNLCTGCVTPLVDIMTPAPETKIANWPYALPPDPLQWKTMRADERLADAGKRLLPSLHAELAKRGAKLGNAAYIRAFKENRELELWLNIGSEWTHFRTYPIAALSGHLGPKLAEGDGQTPEGFYAVKATALNPASSYHLAFNIGYPNAYDLQHQRTGSLIMVHGSNVSIGCLAMTDPAIEEIYWIVSAALEAGQREVPVHLFPFRMTEDHMGRYQASEHASFWRELKAGYDWFETHRRPPAIQVSNGRYVATETL